MEYLLNATVIWLVSLVAFELFFRRETVHWLNRAYLAGTLVLGFLLPLWRWQRAGVVTSNAVRVPVVQAARVREAIVQSAGLRPAAAGHGVNWLLAGYVLGIVVSVVFMLRAVISCIVLYRSGRMTNETGYTLVETGKGHGPFSFFRTVFISDKNDYTEEELQLVLRHELRHARLLHSADVLIMQVVKVVLWFHPLVYWYDRRLRMVHEYEADAAGKGDTVTYGQFLIEQALLQHAPAIAHSFHHSPIKTRIVMLMRNRTTRIRMTKYLLALPIIAFLSLACTRDEHGMERERKGNIVYCEGNAIEVNTLAGKHLGFSDGVDSSGILPKGIDSFPIKLNGDTIYEEEYLTVAPKPDMGGKDAAQFVFDRLKAKLEQLGDGTYVLSTHNCVLGTNGRVVYFDAAGIADRLTDMKSGSGAQMDHIARMLHSPGGIVMERVDKAEQEKDDKKTTTIANWDDTKAASVPPAIKGEIDAALQDALTDLKFSPAMKNGKAVPAFADNQIDLSVQHSIKVAYHKATLLGGMKRGNVLKY